MAIAAIKATLLLTEYIEASPGSFGSFDSMEEREQACLQGSNQAASRGLISNCSEGELVVLPGLA